MTKTIKTATSSEAHHIEIETLHYWTGDRVSHSLYQLYQLYILVILIQIPLL